MSVEITVKHVTTVDSLTEAWSFVMGRLDLIENVDRIIITRKWRPGPGIDDWIKCHEVVVEGMTEVAPDVAPDPA